MNIETKRLPEDGTALWVGYGSFVLESPNRKHHIMLQYEGEPPHGDSFHSVDINGRRFPGWAWGGSFAFSRCSRYFVFRGMQKRWDRLTIVVDADTHRYAVLPAYLDTFGVDWPLIKGSGSNAVGQSYSFNGSEEWRTF